MNFHSRILSLFTVIFVSTLVLAACSDDDDGTGPGDNGPAIKMNVGVGSYYNYNVWNLDANNNKDGDSREVRITYLDNGLGQIDGFDEYVILKETDMESGQSNDPDDRSPMRIANNGDYYIHSYQHDLYNSFFDLLKMVDENIEVPAVVKTGYKKWDCIGDFNDDQGNANPKGYTWKISEENMEPFTFNISVSGIPLAVSVFPEISGVYDGQISETINMQNRDIKQWQVRIFVKMAIRTSLIERDVTLNQTITFSDDPDCQISILRESANIDLSDIGLGVQTIPGEKWELKSFVAN